MIIDELIDEMFEKFEGLPSDKPIVRVNTRNDAFTLVVLKILYEDEMDLTFDKSSAIELSKKVIPPPDAGIDIFIERSDGDSPIFDVIQVKYQKLAKNQIEDAFRKMKETIEDYCKDSKNIGSNSCLEVLSNSSLEESNKNACRYYVVHKGERKVSTNKDDEFVINIKNLIDLYESGGGNVRCGKLALKEEGACFNYKADKKYESITCVIDGYSLAELNNAYNTTSVGVNRLFKQNFRDYLATKKNEASLGMKKTVETSPEEFYSYNNGITIVAEEVEFPQDDKTVLLLKNFSIVNGAQTTGSLGDVLSSARAHKNKSLERKLKKVAVLARINVVKKEDISDNIAIYNNTQNPMENRDFVSRKAEQIHLNKWLINNPKPSIYVEIRRGTKPPKTFVKKYLHRKTDNEQMGQIAYAAFEKDPYTAKDKARALFNRCLVKVKEEEKYDLTEDYYRIFRYSGEEAEDNGILFKKSKNEIDEALFVDYLYKSSKNKKIKDIKEEIKTKEDEMESAKENEVRDIKESIMNRSELKQILGVCRFYCITAYYLFKSECDAKDDRVFAYEKFYSDKIFKDELISNFANVFLMYTARVLKESSKNNKEGFSMTNWIRNPNCKEMFITQIKEDLLYVPDLKNKYNDFIEKYKVKQK